jgi:L-amino acid N-acyltransferase YncA
MRSPIRRCSPDDAPRLTAIYNQAIAGVDPAAPDVEPVTVENRLAWISRHRDDPHPAWVWDSSNDGVTAFAGLGPFAVRPDWDWIVELSLYVDRDARHGMIGSTLGLHALAEAGRFGFRLAVARVFRSNRPMLRAAHAFGFRSIAELPGASCLRGQRQDESVLVRSL